MIGALRFVRAYLRGAPVREEEVRIAVSAGVAEATLYLPNRVPAPAWVVLHGITLPGRRHPSLVRFARSLAAAGNTVIVPDVPVWRALDMAPAAAGDAIAGAADYLLSRSDLARAEGVGVVGFSVGATQALIAAAEPRLRERVRSVVGFGGYCDLPSTIRFMCTGEYEYGGRSFRVEPDPYGRWVVARKQLTRIPRFAGMERVARAVAELAAETGRRGVMASDASLDPLKRALREPMDAEERRVFDLLAPPAGHAPADLAAARRLADELAEAALADDPRLDPRPVLPDVHARVVLSHGRDDRLIPFPQSLLLRDALPARTQPTATLTRLFAHSHGSGGLGALAYAAEAVRFLRLLDRAFG